jgi:M6 family metalloprotease-like protein
LVDFSQYDNDGDGYVDGVIVVHQGTDEAAGNGSPTDIWSHMWSLNGGQYWMGCPAWMTPCGEYITNDGVKVNTYTIQAEVASDWGMATVGVFAHETGHLLGLPDLYDYGYDSDGAGLWTLMAAGSWNSISRPGDSPAHLMAWEKWALGWLTPTAVTSPLISASISQVEDNAVAYQLLDNPGGPGDWFSDCTASSGEYFLVENRQRVGFDTALPGDGLLIWHIDESPIGSQCRYNNDQTHKLVDLEEASGPQDLDVMGDGNAGGPEDPYPGASNNRTFDDASDPNSKLYDGSPSGVCVANISDSGSTMTANMGISGCPAPGTPAVFRVTRGGDVYADRAYYCGLDSGCFNVGVGADIAEYIKVSEPVEPGDVVELDPDRPGYYRKSRGPYSTLAVGVISSTPGITMGPPEPQPPSWLTLSLDLFISHFGGPKLTLGGLSLQAVLEGKPLGLISIMIPHTGFIELASRYRLRDQPLLALMGVVPVKVTTENGPIQPGDLLISSSTPGYAMRCDEPKECEGAIIGKALEPLKEGTGVIKMLVMR